MEKEYKKLKKLSKEIISKDHHRKINKLPSSKDRAEGLKYLVISKLKIKLLELEEKSRKISKKDELLVESKLILLKSKIKIFETTYKKRDYKVVEKLIKKIEEEIKCSD